VNSCFSDRHPYRIRLYKPHKDAVRIFNLASTLFKDSALFGFESVNDFLHFDGILVESAEDEPPGPSAFILYTIHNGANNGDTVYLEFIGSAIKGWGTKLLNLFTMVFQGYNMYLHVEKEREGYERLISWYKKHGFNECSISNFHVYDNIVNMNNSVLMLNAPITPIVPFVPLAPICAKESKFQPDSCLQNDNYFLKAYS